jgi:hypothetical protein
MLPILLGLIPLDTVGHWEYRRWVGLEDGKVGGGK